MLQALPYLPEFAPESDERVKHRVTKELFLDRWARSEDLKILKPHLSDLSDLTFVHIRDLIDLGVLPRHINALRLLMNEKDGTGFLHYKQHKPTALVRHFGDPMNIPFRLMFFGSPIPGKLKRAGINSVGELLDLSTNQLAGLRTCKRHDKRQRITNALDIFDTFEVKVVLSEYSLYLHGAVAIRA